MGSFIIILARPGCSNGKRRQSLQASDRSPQGVDEFVDIRLAVAGTEADPHRAARDFRRHAHRPQHMRGFRIGAGTSRTAGKRESERYHLIEDPAAPE